MTSKAARRACPYAMQARSFRRQRTPAGGPKRAPASASRPLPTSVGGDDDRADPRLPDAAPCPLRGAARRRGGDLHPGALEGRPRLVRDLLATTDGNVYEVGDADCRSRSSRSRSRSSTGSRSRTTVARRSWRRSASSRRATPSTRSASTRRPAGRCNPMINAGAIAASSLVAGHSDDDKRDRMLELFSLYAGRRWRSTGPSIESEKETGHRNRAIGHMLRNFDILGENPEGALDLLLPQCSILVTCRDLSLMAATLANGGVNPFTGETRRPPELVPSILSVMTTCGMYDFAGEWTFAVGLPAKSGVAGGDPRGPARAARHRHLLAAARRARQQRARRRRLSRAVTRLQPALPASAAIVARGRARRVRRRHGELEAQPLGRRARGARGGRRACQGLRAAGRPRLRGRRAGGAPGHRCGGDHRPHGARSEARRPRRAGGRASPLRAGGGDRRAGQGHRVRDHPGTPASPALPAGGARSSAPRAAAQLHRRRPGSRVVRGEGARGEGRRRGRGARGRCARRTPALSRPRCSRRSRI